MLDLSQRFSWHIDADMGLVRQVKNAIAALEQLAKADQQNMSKSRVACATCCRRSNLSLITLAGRGRRGFR